MDITVYTCITAEKDTLIDTQNMEGARFIAFSDQKSRAWEMCPPCTAFSDPRKNARLQKIMPHKFLDSRYSIYIDGNIALCVPARQLIEEFLQDKDIAVFRHPYRDCIYDEAKVCARHGLDSARILKKQTADYRKAGYPKKAGLCECNFIIRRHTPGINELNEKWWAECCHYSVRDQISFPFVFPLKKVALIEGNIRSHPYFRYYQHNYYNIYHTGKQLQFLGKQYMQQKDALTAYRMYVQSFKANPAPDTALKLIRYIPLVMFATFKSKRYK